MCLVIELTVKMLALFRTRGCIELLFVSITGAGKPRARLSKECSCGGDVTESCLIEPSAFLLLIDFGVPWPKPRKLAVSATL